MSAVTCRARQVQADHGSAASRVTGDRHAAVSGGDGLDVGQSQPGASVITRAAGVRATQALERVRQESGREPGTVVADLDRLAVSGGQFFWRFLTRELWCQAHPNTLSALPQPPYLRLTVKCVGDHSAALARLEPGTRVAIEPSAARWVRASSSATGCWT